MKLELFEVKRVFTDVDTKLSGAIKGKLLGSNPFDSSTDNWITLYPADPNILTIPLKGEVVLGFFANNKHNYFSKLNFGSDGATPVHNVKPNVSSMNVSPDGFQMGNYFIPLENNSKKLLEHEGDTIIQGRFGNSIRLGSNQIEDYNLENDEYDLQQEGKHAYSPNIKIVCGNDTSVYPTLYSWFENINQEFNSIYLTTNEDVKFNYEDSNKEIQEVSSDKLPQITLSSTRLVFNSRERFNVYSPEVNLGGVNTQPLVKGNNQKEMMEKLLDIINTISKAVPGLSEVVTGQINLLQKTYLSKEIGGFKNEKYILSNKVNTE